MRYHTTTDNITIAFDSDSDHITLRLDSADGGPVVIQPNQLGIIRLVRRGLNDLFEAQRERDERKRQEREHA